MYICIEREIDINIWIYVYIYIRERDMHTCIHTYIHAYIHRRHLEPHERGVQGQRRCESRHPAPELVQQQ